MRFVASCWKRFPGREVAPTLLMAVAIFGAHGHAAAFVQAFFGSHGFVWG
jgi:hypothetical protein